MVIGRVVYACDVGSTRGSAPRFSWVRLEPTRLNGRISAYSSLPALIDSIGQDMEKGHNIALGFEAPLFIPVPRDVSDLSRGRVGEGNRPFSSQAGLAVATLAIHQAAWILMMLRSFKNTGHVFTSAIESWPPLGATRTLFCWEAFVSGQAHSDSHARDAANAAYYFCQHEVDLANVNAVTGENPFSLISAVAIWSGWTNDIASLHKPTLVLKPTHGLPHDIVVDQRRI